MKKMYVVLLIVTIGIGTMSCGSSKQRTKAPKKEQKADTLLVQKVIPLDSCSTDSLLGSNHEDTITVGGIKIIQKNINNKEFIEKTCCTNPYNSLIHIQIGEKDTVYVAPITLTSRTGQKEIQWGMTIMPQKKEFLLKSNPLPILQKQVKQDSLPTTISLYQGDGEGNEIAEME